MKIEIRCQGKILISNVQVANTIFERLIGLMFFKMPKEEGLLLEPCNSIHTFFMRYPLDVVFISKKNEAIKIVRNLKPWRVTWIYFKASKTLELPAGKLPLTVKEGDVLEVINV